VPEGELEAGPAVSPSLVDARAVATLYLEVRYFVGSRSNSSLWSSPQK
jgi:hypothetical protein